VGESRELCERRERQQKAKRREYGKKSTTGWDGMLREKGERRKAERQKGNEDD
jgi:hypothetical protein